MKKYFISILYVFFPAVAGTQSVVFSEQCPLGCPQNINDTSVILVRKPYISSINPDTGWVHWTAYSVQQRYFGKRPKASFKSDPLLPQQIRKTPADFKGLYKKYKVDRGHMAPASTFGNYYGKETFFLSNILPQSSALNRGVWKKVEVHERKSKNAFVIAGGVQTAQPMQWDFWKVIVWDAKNKDISALWFKKIKTTKGEKQKYCYINMPLSKLQKKTQLEFFTYHTVTQSPLRIKGLCKD